MSNTTNVSPSTDFEVLDVSQPSEPSPLQVLASSSTSRPRATNKKVTSACTNCKRDHASCDSGRPCKRCVQRGVADSCFNGESRKRGPKRYDSPIPKARPTSPESNFISVSPTSSDSYEPVDGRYGGMAGIATEQAIPQEGGDSIFNWFMLSNGFEASSPTEYSLAHPETTNIKTEGESEPPSLYIRSEESLYRLHSVLLAKGITNIWSIEEMRERQQKIFAYREFVTQEQKKMMKEQFNEMLSVFIKTANTISVPTVVWDRTGVIHYANDGYIELTDFSGTLPSTSEDLFMMEMVSSSTLSSLAILMRDIFPKPDTKNAVIEGEARLWTKCNAVNKFIHSFERDNFYVHGQIYLTIKRDVLGLPCLFMTHFFPYPNKSTFISRKGNTLDDLLAAGKITQEVYLSEKRVEREQKEKKIEALKERLKDCTVSEQRTMYQKKLDELELD
ncbi:hypothetical protein PROFUN_08705 [Planoprotostelium fungivorum]|uniref:Zn(2)-C6 fungal-type domain-containing protein n=1 Tax=Planoprotostelium fungivorum TaxID=1890364 RepID=A0A2P6MQU3_9EUKA|nr:hypothetical protein PROFUN_08705 [Planoprotostelium fungivorum]